MEFYPFDRQNCQIILVNKGNAGENVKLIEDTLSYLGPIDMLQYYIEKPIFLPSKGQYCLNIQFTKKINKEYSTKQSNFGRNS